MQVEELLKQAESLARERRFKEAIDLLDQAQKAAPPSGKLYLHQGAIRLAAGDVAGARQNFEAAIALDGADSRAHTGLGMCFLNGGDEEQAYKSFVRAVSVNAEDSQAMLQLIGLAWKLRRFDVLERALAEHTKKARDPNMLYSLAGVKFELGKLEEAKAALDAALMAAPDHKPSLELKVKVDAAMASRPADATEHIEKILAAADEKNLSNLSKEAFDLLATVPAHSVPPSLNVNYHLTLGETLFALGRRSEAEAAFAKASFGVAESARALTGKGFVALENAQDEEAYRCFERALQLDAKYHNALGGLGLYYGVKGDIDKAVEACEEALKISAESRVACITLAKLTLATGRASVAEPWIDGFLELHPFDLQVLGMKAECEIATGRLGDAEKRINDIRVFAPQDELVRELDEKLRIARQ